MEETHFVGLPNPLNLYGICKVWHTGVLKILIANGNQLLSAMALEEGNFLSWKLESQPVLVLPEKAQIISIATANPLTVGRSVSGEGSNSKPTRRCLIGVTYCIPPPPVEEKPPEPEPAPPPKPAVSRPSGATASYVSRILQGTRPPPQAQPKPTETAPQPLVPPRFFFSILGTNSYEMDHWSTVVEDNVTFELSYVPFVLAKYAPPNSSSILFMLSGADRKIHVFNQHADPNSVDSTQAQDLTASTDGATSKTSDAKETGRLTPDSLALPLLEQYPSPVVSIDVLDAVDGQTHVIVGCQDGHVIYTRGDSSGKVTYASTTCLDGPITSVRIYQVARNATSRGSTLIPTENDQTEKSSVSAHPSVRRLAKHISRATLTPANSTPSTSTPASSATPNVKTSTPTPQSVTGSENPSSSTPLHTSSGNVEKVTSNASSINVIVASAVGCAAVFRNVAEHDFDDFQLLPDSDKHDAVLGLAVSDIDHDGHVEILVGTYGQRLLVYAETKGKPKRSQTPKSSRGRTSSTHHSHTPSPVVGPTTIPVSGTVTQQMPQHLQQQQEVLQSTPVVAQAVLPSSTVAPMPQRPRGASRASDLLSANSEALKFEAAMTSTSVMTSGDVGSKFARILDMKQEEYIRDNVVTSVLPPTTLSQKMQDSSTQDKDAQPPSAPIVDFRSSPAPPGAKQSIPFFSITDSIPVDSPSNLIDPQESPSLDDETEDSPTFSLMWSRTFTHPIYQILCDDFVQDGTVAVITSTLYGVHMLRTDFDGAVSKARRRLQLLSDIIKLERQIYRQEKNNSRGGLMTPQSAEDSSVTQ